MKEFKISVPCNFIKAMAKIAGKNDHRDFLNGIRFIRDEKSSYVVACNGKVAVYASYGEGSDEDNAPYDYLFPTVSCAAVSSKKSLAYVTIKENEAVLEADDKTIMNVHFEEHFNPRRLIKYTPDECESTKECSRIDPYLLGDVGACLNAFNKISNLKTVSYELVSNPAQDGILVKSIYSSNIFGLVMPVDIHPTIKNYDYGWM